MAKRFESIVRSVTISREDMQSLLEMRFEEIQDWSPVSIVLTETRADGCRLMAESMVNKINENNRLGRPTTFIVPVGPVLQYPIAAEISNRERVSWKNVWTFNMDEYLDWQGRPIPESHPMSFHGSMNVNLWSKLDPELRAPESQRWFPDPFEPDAIDKAIDEVTGGQGVDICYGGIGEHGHVAFNESPDIMAHYTSLTPDEFKRSSTRVLPHLNPETLSRAFRNPLYTLCPPGAVTIGMRAILGAKRIELSTAGPQARITAMHPPTMDYPSTLIKERPNPKETVTLYLAKKQA